jgi:amino-acid N-acetyltransferase
MTVRKTTRSRKTPKLTISRADETHASALHALITANLEEGRLLPRTHAEIALHAERFTIVLRGKKMVGCAELAPLSAQVAEVRSLAVDAAERGHGVGTMLVDNLRQRALEEGFDKLSAFTHAPGYFSQMGFSIVPHVWMQEKIFTDCVKCPSFRRCGQYAMVVPLDGAAVSDPAITTIPLDRLRQGDGGQARA